MNKIVITTGFELDANGERLDEFVQHHALEEIRDLLISNFGGYTQTFGEGGWDPGPGLTSIKEPVIIFTVMLPDDVPITNYEWLAKYVAQTLKQHSVMLEVYNDVNAQFVDAE